MPNDPTRPPDEPIRPPIVPDEREVPPPPPINDPSPPPPPQALDDDGGIASDASEEAKALGDTAAFSEGPAQEAVDRAAATVGDEDIADATDRVAGEESLESQFERDEDIGDGTNRTVDAT